MPTKPLTAAAFDGRIAALNRQIEAARQEIAEHSLKLVEDPDDKQAHLVIEKIESEITAHQATRTRLEAARTEAQRRDGVASRAEYLAGLTAEAEKAEALGDEMADVTERIVRTLESIAPLLARFEELSTERGLLTYGVMRAGADAGATSRADWGGIKDSANLRRSPLSIAVACALWRSGLGRVGPEVKLQLDHLLPHMLAGPNAWRNDSSDLCALMREGYETWKTRLMDRLAHVVEETEKVVAKEAQ